MWMLSVYTHNAFCNVLFTVCLLSCFIWFMLCAKEVSSYLGCVSENAWKSSHKVYRKSPPPFSLGLIIYCIVWGMFKITNPETQWPMGRKESQSRSSFFEQCLHGGGSDGGTCRTHPDRSCWFECLSLCVMTFELLHKIFLQNYHWVSFILFFHLNTMWWKRTCTDVETACAPKGPTGCIWCCTVLSCLLVINPLATVFSENTNNHCLERPFMENMCFRH